MKSNLKALMTVVAMAAMSATAVGCAHGTPTLDRGRHLRGGARVGQEARALLVGPARLVHATGDKPVRWFVADRVKGDDRDCARSAAAAVLPASDRARVAVSPGQVLCASVATGATDVMWHKFPDGEDGLWASR